MIGKLARLFGALLVYFAIGIFMADTLTLRPHATPPPQVESLAAQDKVTVTARDGLRLAGTFIPATNSPRAVLMVHGLDGCHSCELYGKFPAIAAQLSRAGYNVLLIDLRGHGESPVSRVTFGDTERWDVLGALDWLHQRSLTRVGVLGISLGAVVTVRAALEPDGVQGINAMVLDSCFGDFGEVMARTVRRAPVTGVLQLFASPFFFIVSAIVFLLRPRQPAAHALLHIGTGFLFQATPNVSSVPLLFYGGVPRSTAVPWDYWTGAILPGLLYLVLAFPTPKWPLRVWPRLTVAAIYVGPMLAINLAYLANLHDRLAFGQVSLLIYASAGSTVLIATLLSLTHSARRLRDPVARSQLKWMTIGLLSFVVLGIGGWFAGVMGVWAELAQSLATFGWFVFPVTLAIAITRYRLFDIDLIIRRTLIYSALTAVLALAYLGSVLLLQSIFQALTGRAQDQLVAVVSTLVIAALFGPLRWRVQNVIDRRFYRRKYDAAKIVTAFGSALRDDVELNRLAAHLVETVETAMEPAHTTLLLKAQPIGPYQPLTP